MVVEINGKPYLFTPDVIKNKWFDFIYYIDFYVYTTTNKHKHIPTPPQKKNLFFKRKTNRHNNHTVGMLPPGRYQSCASELKLFTFD